MPVNRQLARRQGWVWPAIRRVLPAADAPMRPVAIYAAVVDDLDRPVSKSTIKNQVCADASRWCRSNSVKTAALDTS